MLQHQLYKILVFSCLFLPFVNGHSQTPFMKQIPLLRGKEAYQVNVIYQDPTGLMWFGTDRGLFRYDGINYDQFGISDSLAGNEITAINSDHLGTLWIGHKNGKISTYTNNSFSIFRPEGGLGTIEITDITPDSSGNIWFSTLGEGVYKYDGRFLSNLNMDDGLSDNYVYDIEIVKNGDIWLATDYGISIRSDDSIRIFSMKDGLPDNIVRVLAEGSDGRIWLGTEEEGLSVLDPKDYTISKIEGWSFGAITGFAMNLENELWISTSSQGIIKLNFESADTKPFYQQITYQQGLISNRLNTVVKDRENNIWIGGEKGVVQALPPVFEFLDATNTEIPFEMVYSFSIDPDGNSWVCSETGLFEGKPDASGNLTWHNVSETSDAKLNGLNFISVYIDTKGNIWAGTYGSGVFRFLPSGRIYKHYTSSNGLFDDNVINITGNDSTIWFSTLGGGVSAFDIQSNEIINFKDKNLNQSYIYSADTDTHGKTWIAGSLKSPAYISNGKVSYLTDSSIKIPQLYGIAFSSDDQVWFNTNDKGILHISDDDSIHIIGMDEGINFNEIQSIIFDKWDNLLLISNQGILFFRPDSGIIMSFGENTGLAYRYPILNSVYEDKSGKIWIGTETGIIKYNPDYINKISNSPRIFLSTINLFGRPLNRSITKFKHNENNFTFGYTGIWFTNPEALTYRYKLNGYDLEWTYSKRNQPFTYSKLPPGKYRFEAQASIDGKNWISTENSYFSFLVNPPFWKRAWFIILVILLIITGVYLYIRMRLANLKRAKEELEKEVLVRTEEIRNQNEELEAQKEEISAQRDLAQEQRDQIEHQKEEIQASIRYAHRIQTAALPPVSQMKNLLKDHFILNKPRDIVSGDFYWLAKREENIFFAVADCTGHGVPGAFMSMLGLSALNDIVKSLDTCTAAKIVDLLGERIKESLHQGEGDESSSTDGMDISLCIYNQESKTLQFAAAHNSLYIVRNGNMKIIPADRIGIGSGDNKKYQFTNNVVEIESGDILYLFSDGFPDQFGGTDGKKYKYKNFREFLMKIHKEPLIRQKWLLDEEIEVWKLGYEQVDDIMLMGVKIQ